MVAIRALRGFFVDGRSVAAGATVQVSALDAGEAVATGRAEYASNDDKQETQAAVQKARERAFPLSQERSTYWSRSKY